MSVFFYDIFLFLFRIFIHIASPFNSKAKKWTQGRKNIFEKLKAAIAPGEKIVWMHCASLGEFEQGRPILEKIRNLYPGYKILLTFFSPSGYEAKKNYNGAEWIFYLPLDGAKNAKKFLEIVHPSLIFFVKYEFWYFYLKKIKYRNIPLILVSALFRKSMMSFKWYGKLQRKMLGRFDHLFVQDHISKNLVDGLGLSGICSISGDTRFDRVIEIAQNFKPIDLIEKFIGESKTIVAGSTWPEDEKVLQQSFNSISTNSLKLIIAPHEIDEKHLQEIKELFPTAILFSQLQTSNIKLQTSNILIIDNIGILGRLYKYAFITYIGGGFTSKGVHNVLEAAVYNKIILFGPYYHKYNEAVGLIKSGGAISFTDKNVLQTVIEKLLSDKIDYDQRSKAAGDFVFANKGATEKIMQFIQEKRLLTN